MAMNKQVLGVSVLIFTFLLTPALVLAQSSSQVVDFIWVKTFKFERQWLNNPNQLILQALLPAVAIYAIFLGLLRTMRLFAGMGSMDHVIALIIMFVMLFTGGLAWISGGLLVLGSWSFIVFFVLFFIGSILYAKGYLGSYRRSALGHIESAYKSSASSLEKRIKAYNKKIDELETKASKQGNAEQRNRLLDEAEKYQVRKGDLENQLRELRRALNDAVAAGQ